MAVMSILLVAMASAIVIAAHALPDPDRPTTRLIRTAEVVNDLLAELEEARYVTHHDAQSIAFTVADRDGDGSAERVRYSWSGTAGDPLRRTYNGGAAVDVIASVEQLALGYGYTAITEEYPGPPVEGEETLLASYTGSADIRDQTIERKDWAGQYVSPSLPADAISYRVTRAYLSMRMAGWGSPSMNYVEIRPAGADGLPTETVLAQTELSESSLSYFYAQWVEIALAQTQSLPASEPACLVLRHSGSGDDSGRVEFDNGGGADRLRFRNNAWSRYNSESLIYYLYGRASTPGPVQSVTRHYITTVHVDVQADAEDAPIATSARMLNTPEVLAAVWEAEFDATPIVDLNGDGAADWHVRDGSTFTTAKLVGGVWSASQCLDTAPDHPFLKNTTVEVAMRQTAVNGNGAGFWINADYASGSITGISVLVKRETDKTQTLRLRCLQADGSQKVLDTVSGLPEDFVTVRLVLEPDRDTVNLQVNGALRGTWYYQRRSTWDANYWATVWNDGSGCEFDYVRLRVSGDLP